MSGIGQERLQGVRQGRDSKRATALPGPGGIEVAFKEGGRAEETGAEERIWR